MPTSSSPRSRRWGNSGRSSTRRPRSRRAMDIVLVEDSVEDAELLELAMEDAGLAVRWTRVETRGALEQALRERVPDLVVSDLRSEEHTSELQSRENLVCRLLLEN